LVMHASFLPAGFGGEGENGCGVSLCAPVARSRLVGGCYLMGKGSSSSSLARRGGGKEDNFGATTSS
jgi:hypothetical protein